MRRIQFFIAGVQKGGTTALDQMLRKHPAIQMATVKEVHFFDNDTVDWSAPNLDLLHSKFDWTNNHVVRGEATPIYLYWPESLARIRNYNLEARFIIGLRHPSFRAFSHWRMEFMRGNETLPFCEAIQEKARHRVGNAPNGVHRIFSYLERGLYFPQIVRLLRLFPRHQIYFFRTDRLWSDQDHVLGEIQDFLGVNHDITVKKKYIVPINSSHLGVIPASSRKDLNQFFTEDIKLSAKETGLDLSDWLTIDYQEPMTFE
jgi:hypothetical protein